MANKGRFPQSVFRDVHEPSILTCLTPLFITAALICSCAANFSCEFVTLDLTLAGRSHSLGLGLFNYQGWSYLIEQQTLYYAQTCVPYGYEGRFIQPDSMWYAAQAMGIIAVVIGTCALALNCCQICTASPTKSYGLYALMYALCGICQGCTLFLIGSDACKANPIVTMELPIYIEAISTGCSLSWGSNVSIASTVLWLFGTFLMLCVGSRYSSNASNSLHDVDDVGMKDNDNVEEQALAMSVDDEPAPRTFDDSPGTSAKVMGGE